MVKRFNWILILVLIFLDIISKFLVRMFNLRFGIFNYTLNSGVAFGLFSGFGNLLFILLTLIFIGVLVYLILKSDKSYLLGLNLVFIGAVGNLIDRIVYSGVVDFIDLKYWYIFNLADAFIVVGGFIVLFVLLKGEKADR